MLHLGKQLRNVLKMANLLSVFGQAEDPRHYRCLIVSDRRGSHLWIATHVSDLGPEIEIYVDFPPSVDLVYILLPARSAGFAGALILRTGKMANRSEESASDVSNGNPIADHPSTPSTRIATSVEIQSKQDAGCSGSTISFAGINESRSRPIKLRCSRSQIEQRERDSTGQMPPFPFALVPNINKLHRRIVLQSLTYIGTPMCSDARKVDTFAVPTYLVRERVPDHVFEANPDQSSVRFLNVPHVFGNQDEILCRCDKHRRPTREGTNETNLNRAWDMK